jgi:hypothetical protein
MPFVDAWSHAEIDRVIEVSGSAHMVKDDRDRARHSVALEMAIGRVIEDAASELEQEFEKLSTKFDDAPGVTPATFEQR